MSAGILPMLTARAVRCASGRAVVRLTAPDYVGIRAGDDDAWQAVDAGQAAQAILSTPDAQDRLWLTDGRAHRSSIDYGLTWQDESALPGQVGAVTASAESWATGAHGAWALAELRLDSPDGVPAALALADRHGVAWPSADYLDTVLWAGGATDTPAAQLYSRRLGLRSCPAPAWFLDRVADGRWVLGCVGEIVAHNDGGLVSSPFAALVTAGAVADDPTVVGAGLTQNDVGRLGIAVGLGAAGQRVAVGYAANPWSNPPTLATWGWAGPWLGDFRLGVEPWLSVDTVITPYCLQRGDGAWEVGWRDGAGSWQIYRSTGVAGGWTHA
jgi:hypothetical protein